MAIISLGIHSFLLYNKFSLQFFADLSGLLAVFPCLVNPLMWPATQQLAAVIAATTSPTTQQQQQQQHNGCESLIP